MLALTYLLFYRFNDCVSEDHLRRIGQTTNHQSNVCNTVWTKITSFDNNKERKYHCGTFCLFTIFILNQSKYCKNKKYNYQRIMSCVQIDIVLI